MSGGNPIVRVHFLDHYKGDWFRPAHKTDVGIDLFSTVAFDISPGERVLVPCGISVAVPFPYEAQIRPKSGLALNRGLTVLNTPGTIDPGYRGEVKVILQNHNPVITRYTVRVGGKDGLFEDLRRNIEIGTVSITPGMKIAQMVFARFERPEITQVYSSEELASTSRGAGGFGSTGS
jgi:dUTP pyrophosphatase